MASKTDKRNYCVFAVFMIPVGSVEAGEHVLITDVPAGAPMVTEIVEQADLYTDDDWETFGHTMMTAFAARCRRMGWPEWTAPSDKPDLAAPESVYASEEPEIPTNHGRPYVDKPDDGSCWACGAMPVTLPRGSVCPNGCEAWIDVFGPDVNKTIAAREAQNAAAEASTKEPTDLSTEGRGLETYAPTRENPKPDSFPQGEVLPTTD